MRFQRIEETQPFCQPKKYYFHKNEVCFLGYVVLAQKVQIEDERIEAIRNWPKSKSIKDI